MHELSIAHSILNMVEGMVEEDAHVIAVQLEIGTLSSIEKEALVFAFDIIKKDTALCHAALQIKDLPGEANCLDCNTIFELNSYATPCPNCSSYRVSIIKGKEMRVVSFEVDE